MPNVIFLRPIQNVLHGDSLENLAQRLKSLKALK